MQQNNVKFIKAFKPIGQVINENHKLRVVAYCRVSTDGEEQINSFTSQVTYYKDKIQGNKDWEYAGIYSDEAVTGTKVSTRDGFQKNDSGLHGWKNRYGNDKIYISFCKKYC